MPQIKDKTTGRFSPMVLDENMLRQKHLVERKSSREIAKELGSDISSMTVHRALKEFGIYHPTYKLIMPDERAKILKRYVEECKSTPEVAAELGISINRVDGVVKQAGVRRNHVESNAIRFENYYAETDDILIKKYVEERKSISEIQKEMKGDVQARLRQLGVTRTTSEANFNRSRGRVIKLDNDELKRLYVDEKLSVSDIALKLGVSGWPVQERLKQMGVTRNLKEASLLLWQQPNYREKVEPGLAKSRHPRLLSDEDTALMIKKYVEEGKSVAQISDEMHIDAYVRLHKLGLTRSSSEAILQKFYGRPVEIDEDKIRSMYLDFKMTLAAIAKEVGVTQTVIRRIVQKFKIGRSRAEAAILAWQKPQTVENILKALAKRPNVQELHVDSIIQKYFPKEFEYNGGYELGVTVERKVPDWVHINGRRKLIEFNGCFFHSCPQCGYEMNYYGLTTEKVRRRDKRKLEAYKKHGFETLVIWGHDTDEEIIDKVRAFVFNGDNANKEHTVNES